MLGLAIIVGAWLAAACWCIWFGLTVEKDCND